MNEAIHLISAMLVFVGAVVVVSGILFAALFCQDIYRIQKETKNRGN